MNKSELVSAIAKAGGLEKRHSEKAVDALVSTIVGEIKNGHKVSLIGFGTFNPTSRGARQGRNPQTGAPVRIAPSRGVRFAAGSAFKAAVNGRGPVPTVTPLPPPPPPRTAGATKTKKAGGRKKAAAKRATGRKTVKKVTRKKATTRRAPARRTAKKTTARRTTKKATRRR